MEEQQAASSSTATTTTVAWHKEAAKRGLPNLRTTPEALPYLLAKDTLAIFRKYKVLCKRELESRFEVFTEQYGTLINIEAETAVSIARTMLLPAAVRYLAELHDSGIEELAEELEPLVEELRVRLLAAGRREPRREPARTARRKSTPSTCATR